MQSLWFFLLMFTAIFGAVKLLSMLYGAVVGFLLKRTGAKGNNVGK